MRHHLLNHHSLDDAFRHHELLPSLQTSIAIVEVKERLEPTEMTPIEQTPTGISDPTIPLVLILPLTDPMTPLDPTVPLTDRLVVLDPAPVDEVVAVAVEVVEVAVGAPIINQF